MENVRDRSMADSSCDSPRPLSGILKNKVPRIQKINLEESKSDASKSSRSELRKKKKADKEKLKLTKKVKEPVRIEAPITEASVE